ncbi:hypothetical protein CORT_0B09480 [Candida orthopsilosis Co 90-125]|uniref:Uncharacterized protein n=1 Tax=Candida orthopsilosis (strain 90-125) TaxID=1136231 RepID=H8X0E0_CANO9|nr:hypothetical protein CORT_0B09480 [Candida orthopsilosis Co 90-125]CCG22652.1 hypothetical protein CORT_0B09480 [Candida orthopsilosis Co 90-125]
MSIDIQDGATSTPLKLASNLRSQHSDGNESHKPQNNTNNEPHKDDEVVKTSGSTNGSQKESGQSNDRRISIKFKDMNSTNGTAPLIDTSSIKSYYPIDNSWQQTQSPSQKYSTQRLTSESEKSPTVFPMSNKNRSDSSIKTPRYNQHKRRSTSSSTSSITTPPAVSKSSDNLRILLDRERITPPVLSRDDGGSGYFNLDRTKWKGGAAQSIINGIGGKSDRLKSSVVGDSPGLLSSPWFRDLKGGNVNANSGGSSANASTQSLHTHKMEHLRKEQKNRLVDQFLNSSKKIPPSPGSEMNGSRYFNEDLLPSSLSNSHVNLSALTPLKPSKGGTRGGASEWKKPPDDLGQDKEAVEQVSKEAHLQRTLDREVNLDEKSARLEKQEEKLEDEEKRVEAETPQMKPHSMQPLPPQQLEQQPQSQKQIESVLSNVSNMSGGLGNNLPAYASEDLVNNVLSNGGFRFEYDTKHVIEDDKLVNYLINIDNVLEELEKRKHHHSSYRRKHVSTTDEQYGDLIKILTTISEKVLIKTRALIYAKTNPAKATILQLDLVSQYLRTLHDSMHQLRQDLVAKLSQTRDNNKSVISDNLSKLNEIDSNLNNLEATTNRYKDKIMQQKQLMKNEVNDKLNLLEEINKSIHMHNQNKRNKRIIRLNVVFAGLVVLVGIYLGVMR